MSLHKLINWPAIQRSPLLSLPMKIDTSDSLTIIQVSTATPSLRLQRLLTPRPGRLAIFTTRLVALQIVATLTILATNLLFPRYTLKGLRDCVTDV